MQAHQGFGIIFIIPKPKSIYRAYLSMSIEKSDKMTKITRLILHGFKSFAKRTEIVFGDEFNIVLGPNGSGKSNVLDAICFVLGRTSAKSLRAEKSANLIYNGGNNLKKLRFLFFLIILTKYFLLIPKRSRSLGL